MTDYFKYFRLAFWVIVPIVLLILPATYFDEGSPKCLSILLLGQECFGCGMTRGMMHLIHLDLAEALYHHPLSVVVFPLLAFLWAKWFWKDLRAVKYHRA
ncbi:DUF2752 domain-containing protein [Neolewinella agarilytica]|uniref:DUF2752 domain-containing protein n=1 Tax=Neolewinella agarilytica TaxID=478744 RepID=UPI0023566128|nr:DUF2752 domain-containing protein [Neolewinella agarilytica]